MYNASLKSKNQLLVETFIARIGHSSQTLPVTPTIPPLETRRLRALLMLEETLETVRALGFKTYVAAPANPGAPREPYEVTMDNLDLLTGGEPDLVGIADGCSDVEVVTLGTASACGFAHQPVFEVVMNNNLLKFAPGHSISPAGKLVKPPGHPAATRAIHYELSRQGAALVPYID